MLVILTWIARIVVALAVIGLALWLFGPYEPVDPASPVNETSLPQDLDAFLAAREAEVPNLVPGTEKRIIWHGAPGDQTDLAVIYIHGFSATSEEIRPVPDRVAKNLGANLFFTRLQGHGRDAQAMTEPTAGDWLRDVAEAYAIGRRIGREVIVISTSTGGTLAAATAVDPEMSRGIKGHAFVSPNFALANPAGALLGWPAARYWVPLVAGPDRSFPPRNAQQAQFWTMAYPTIAALPMAAIVKHTARLDMSKAPMGALFFFSDGDQVVSAQATRAVAARWGGPVTLRAVTVAPTDDAYAHVIAGDIMSPSMTTQAVAAITDWALTLGKPPG